jgi:tRNA nucleotidyltransferase/poly(A) polymerase
VSDDALNAVRSALGGERAWLVGGALRDRLLGRPVVDLDLVVEGDVRALAKRLAKAVRGPAFELSEAFGAWRVIGPQRAWHADLSALRGGTLDADLALRDFTINAMAEPLDGGELVDPFGGAGDLAARRLRLVGERALADDPLRVMRLARLACELTLDVDDDALAAAREHAPLLERVAPERVFAELRRIVVADRALEGLTLLEMTGALGVVLPEVTALRGVEQTVYHHRDAYGHTLEVLQHVIEIERDPAIVSLDQRVPALLAEPLADELTRGGGLRFAALLHDIAKPPTQTPNPKGGFGFPHHDALGAEMVADVLARLRTSDRLRAYVAALTRHHLRPGFLVHGTLTRRDVHRYLKATDAVAADTILLSVADRLATRGRKHDEAIGKHLEVAQQLLGPALDWHEHGPPPALVRGDELARELGIEAGPELGRLLAELAEAQYAGEISSREEALQYAKSQLRGASGPAV